MPRFQENVSSRALPQGQQRNTIVAFPAAGLASSGSNGALCRLVFYVTGMQVILSNVIAAVKVTLLSMTFEKERFFVSPKVLLVCLLIFQGSCKTSQPQTAAKNPDANHEQITSKIRDIVAKKLELDPSTIDVDAPLSKQNAPGDELDATEIILDIEDEFHIEIKEEETGGTEQLADRLTVKKLADIVAKKSPK